MTSFRAQPRERPRKPEEVQGSCRSVSHKAGGKLGDILRSIAREPHHLPQPTTHRVGKKSCFREAQHDTCSNPGVASEKGACQSLGVLTSGTPLLGVPFTVPLKGSSRQGCGVGKRSCTEQPEAAVPRGFRAPIRPQEGSISIPDGSFHWLSRIW